MSNNVEQFEPGEVIFLEGESSKGMYILDEGEVEVIKNNRVISVIKEHRTFFGEMAYLLGEKRSATLRAKTAVKVLVIEFRDGESFGKRLTAASMSLLKVMAQRLEAASKEMTRLAPYEYFAVEAREAAKDHPEMKETIDRIEKDIFEKDKEASDELMSHYLMSPRLWTRLKESLLTVLKRHVNDDFDMDRLDTWDPETIPLGDLSCVTFEGDRSGLLVLDIDENLGHYLEKSGIGADANQDGNILSTLILEELKIQLSELDFEMGEPENLLGVEQITKKLQGRPAMKMSITSKTGKMRLIYQLT
jgi:CRP-like cAMP-binding protein